MKYIMKKGKLRTVIAACLATVVLGSAVGFGSSQIIIDVMRIIADENRSNNTPSAISLSAAGITTSGTTDGDELTAIELYARLSDTVVGIKVVNRFGEITDIIGSGVLTSADGFIITCAHVIDGAQEVWVVVDDYEEAGVQHEYEATVLGADTPTDLAMLKIERDMQFKFARIGKSSELMVGQSVVAIGNPLGLHKTMTKGIVSGLGRDLGENTYMLPSIQTDAALNPGNSGCPLFDMYGNIVGIVNIKLVSGSSIDNLGFAISIDEAQPVLAELVEHGLVFSRAMLGITALEITPYNRAKFGGAVEYGMEVETIRAGTPAAASGLSRGDVIIAIDGNKVANVGDIQSIVKNKSVGDNITVTVIRFDNQGKSTEINITFALTNAG
jgi:serine protease Do